MTNMMTKNVYCENVYLNKAKPRFDFNFLFSCFNKYQKMYEFVQEKLKQNKAHVTKITRIAYNA